MSLKRFCRGVRGRGAQTAGRGNGADCSDLSARSLTAEQRHNGIDAADKAGGIRVHGAHFDLRIEFNIFVSDSGRVNIEVTTADFRREVRNLKRRVFTPDIDFTPDHPDVMFRGDFRSNCLEPVSAAACNGQIAPEGGKSDGERFSNPRCRSHDDDVLCHSAVILRLDNFSGVPPINGFYYPIF